MNLVPFGPNVWIADGPPVSAFGPVTLPTRMIVVKLRDGSLWLNSPIEAPRKEMVSVEALGPVGALVAPTALHVWRLEKWAGCFPNAELWGPPAARRSPKAKFDNVLGDAPPVAWSADLGQVVFRGNLFAVEVEFFHHASRTLIMTDFIQNYAARPRRPILNALLRAGGILGVGMPLDIRMSFWSRVLARQSAAAILSWNFDQLIVGHGECVKVGAKKMVHEAFAWLNGK